MATFTVVEFPGQGTARPITLEGVRAKARDILQAAGIAYEANDKRDLAVNGAPTKDLDTEVPDGATVTVTDRIAAG